MAEEPMLEREVPGFFRGTSNVDMARRHDVVPIGTMAHECLQAFQGFGYRLRDFQKMALENWVAEYRGDLTGPSRSTAPSPTVPASPSASARTSPTTAATSTPTS